MPGILEDRSCRRGVGSGTVSVGDPRAGQDPEPDLPHRPLRWRAVRAVDRDARDRGPVRSATQRVIVTRARIEVDPHTAQITVTTDPLPQIIAGVPTDLRLIDSVIDRPGFMFNPTNCNPQEFSGTAWGTPSRPGVGGAGCERPDRKPLPGRVLPSLEFKPSFAVSTSGKTSQSGRREPAAKLTYPNAPQGTQANIARVKVELPKQLPSRLYDAAEGVHRQAVRSQPRRLPRDVDRRAREGDHAAAARPTGRPSVLRLPRRRSLPQSDHRAAGRRRDARPRRHHVHQQSRDHEHDIQDGPRRSRWDLRTDAPRGPLLGACHATATSARASLAMPTEFIAQNGAEIHEITRIAVTGCPKAKNSGKRKRHGKRGKRPRSRGKRK